VPIVLLEKPDGRTATTPRAAPAHAARLDDVG
jgi:hypothetical protein